MRDEPTLRSALEKLVRHIHMHNEALALHVEPSSNLVVVRQELVAEGGGPLRQAIELALSAHLNNQRRVEGLVLDLSVRRIPARIGDYTGGCVTRRWT